MKDEIKKIIKNEELFSDIWASTDLSMIPIDVFTLPIGLTLFGEVIESSTLVCKNLGNDESIDQAFVTTFKKYLYHCEEWEDNYSNKIPKEEWLEYLKQFWIPDYFRSMDFEEVESYDFIEGFKNQLIKFNIPKDYMSRILNKFDNLRLVKYNKSALSYDVFGITDDISFIYSWGIGY